MYQITFSDQSMGELNKIPIDQQLPIIEHFSNLKEQDLRRQREGVGRIERKGRIFYRLRAGDYRIYFEQKDDELYSHFILHRHTVADFIFRMKLPYKEESLFEQDQSFWKYLERLAHERNPH